MKSALPNVEVDDVRDVHAHLEVLLRRLERGRGSDVRATRMWELFAGITRFGSAGTTLLARRVEDSGAWKRTDAHSAAEHLAKLAGSSQSEAQQLLQTSKRVQKLASDRGRDPARRTVTGEGARDRRRRVGRARG